MATIDTIISNINSVLPELTNNSQVSIWRKIAQSIAYTIDICIQEFTNTINIINEDIKNYKLGKSKYYTDVALTFQLGDILLINPDTLDYYYAIIDSSKQIVKKAAFSIGQGNELLLKVAKLDADGKPIALTSSEKSEFFAYFVNFEIAGLPVTKTSENPDTFTFDCKITYYANYNLTTLQTDTTSAFETFRNNFEFDGILYVDQLQKYIVDTVQGVKSCYISNTTINSVQFNWKTLLENGYFDYINNFQSHISYYV